MAKNNFKERMDDFFQRGAWEKARRLLELEREKDPQNHWLLTQLGVTFYEQKRYDEALQRFRESLKIVADCPLTLWNLAGTLDALGKHADAIKFYTWLLENRRSPEEDPCWESNPWADALKTDSVYRLGVCLQHLGKKKAAEDCYRQYLNLLLLGVDGMYSSDDVTQRIRDLHRAGEHDSVSAAVRKAVQAVLRASRSEPRRGRGQNRPPSFEEGELSIGRRAAK